MADIETLLPLHGQYVVNGISEEKLSGGRLQATGQF